MSAFYDVARAKSVYYFIYISISRKVSTKIAPAKVKTCSKQEVCLFLPELTPAFREQRLFLPGPTPAFGEQRLFLPGLTPAL